MADNAGCGVGDFNNPQSSDYNLTAGKKVGDVSTPNSMLNTHKLQHGDYDGVTGGVSIDPMTHAKKGSVFTRGKK